MVSSGEIYKKLKSLGVYSAIKCDGGGSFIMDVNGNRLQTSENRQINAIVKFGPGSTTATTTPGTSTSTSSGTALKTNAKTTANLNMRRGPGTAYASITVIPKSSTIAVDTSYSNVSWYKVMYNGNTGYCSKSYVSMTSTTNESSAASTASTGSAGAATKYASQNPYPVPTRALQQGAAGSDVKWLQWMLHKLGYGSCTLVSYVDGSFGPGTKKSVQNWQKAYGLSADGSFGPDSRAKMITL